MTRPPPPRPTPIKVAAILLTVAASGPVLAAIGWVVGALILGGSAPACVSFVVIALLAPLWGVAISAALRLRLGRVENLNGLRWWVQYLSLFGGLMSLPYLAHTATDVCSRAGRASPEEGLLLGATCFTAICSVCGGIAAVALDVHASEYTAWRDARLLSEEEPGWEYADQ